MAQIRVKYVVEDVDRHGNVRIYLRKPGQKKIRLPGPVGSPEFWKAYHTGSSNNPAIPDKNSNKIQRTPPESFGWLCKQYFASVKFRCLSPDTQRARRGILENLCKEKGTAPYKKLEPRHIRTMRDAKADHPHAANNFLKAINQLFEFAIEYEWIDSNPARDVKRLHPFSKGHHSWSLEEVRQFEATHPVGTKARLAFALLLFTGQRRSDAIRLGKQHLKGGWLRFTQHKNRNRHPVTMEIPVVPELQAVLDASALGDLHFIVTDFGKPFSDGGFGNKFRQWCNEAGLTHCSAHGLRKAAAARLAETGCTEHEIMAITGHQTTSEVNRYTRAARQKRMAQNAMQKINKTD